MFSTMFGDTPTTADLEALEVEAGAVPLDLRREGLEVVEISKIMAKDNGQKISKCFQTWKA